MNEEETAAGDRTPSEQGPSGQTRYADPRIAEAAPIVIMQQLTAERYFTLGETSQPQNLVDGLLYVSPQPTEHHEDTVLAIAEALAAYARAAGGKVFVGRDCWLGDTTVMQPDVAYLAAERAHLAGRFLRGAPDLVVEVVSWGTRRFDREVKLAAYGAAAVREAWLVDLEDKQVTVHAWDGDRWDARPSVLFGDAIPSVIAPHIGAAGLTLLDR